MAAYLYILQAEPMAETVRKSTKIEGIKIPCPNGENMEVKISMFADDTQMYHSTEESIKEGFALIDKYCKASGAKLNWKKTKGVYIGAWKDRRPVYRKNRLGSVRCWTWSTFRI